MNKFKQYMNIFNEMILNKDTDFESQKEMLKQGYLKSGKIKTINYYNSNFPELIKQNIEKGNSSYDIEPLNDGNGNIFEYKTKEGKKIYACKIKMEITQTYGGDSDTDYEEHTIILDKKNHNKYEDVIDEEDIDRAIEKLKNIKEEDKAILKYYIEKIKKPFNLKFFKHIG